MEEDSKEIIHMDHMDLVGDFSDVHVSVGLKTDANEARGVSIQFSEAEAETLLKLLENSWLSNNLTPATSKLCAFMRSALKWSKANPGRVIF